MKPETGIEIINQSECESYARAKISYYSNHAVWSSKDERLSLLKEINDMFDEDIINPDVDLSGATLLYENETDKIDVIRYYDYLYILGSISLALCDSEASKASVFEVVPNAAVDSCRLFEIAYSDILSKWKNKKPNAPVAVLLLVTILESQLRMRFKEFSLQKMLDEVENKIRDGSFSPSSDDLVLMDCLRHRRRDYERVYVESKAAIGLFKKAGITLDECTKKLFENTITLNHLIQYQEFREAVDIRFLTAMREIFGTKKLNLRNDATHEGTGHRNYYSICVAGTLFYLVMMVMENMHKA